jgi:hypothetical protein
MIKALRNILAAAAVALGFALPASATTTLGTDFTDLWWGGASENGWGLNVIHQNNIIFATLYVYNADSTPRFFSASETRATSSNSFSGPLYDTRGTFYGTVPYNAAAFTGTQVGTLTLSFSSPNAGTLTYNVGGTTVTKSITRFGFGPNNLSGNYLGGMTATSTCAGASQLTLIFDTLQVSHSGSSITMTVNFFNNSGVSSRCVFTGSYSQQGSQGSVSGNYSCTFGSTAGNQGTFSVTEISPQQSGFTGRFTGSDQFCTSHSGWFGGVRDVI